MIGHNFFKKFLATNESVNIKLFITSNSTFFKEMKEVKLLLYNNYVKTLPVKKGKNFHLQTNLFTL